MTFIDRLRLEQDDTFEVYVDYPLRMNEKVDIEAGDVEAFKREYVMNKAYADGFNVDGSVRPVQEPDWAEIEHDSIEWFLMYDGEWFKIVEGDVYDDLDDIYLDLI